VQPGTAGTVLLIEEEASLRHVIAEVLRKLGFHVYEAPDGRFGLDLFQVHESKIDVILLDLNLSRLPGREVLRELQLIRPGVRVILTSSREGASTELGDERPWAFLQKPYPLSTLVDLLRQACKP
jgi:two-component system, cell cycle sensor histidine kinase and response regulator CckA